MILTDKPTIRATGGKWEQKRYRAWIYHTELLEFWIRRTPSVIRGWFSHSNGQTGMLFCHSNFRMVRIFHEKKKTLKNLYQYFIQKNGDIFLLNLSRLCTIRFAINYDKIKCCSIKKTIHIFLTKAWLKCTQFLCWDQMSSFNDDWPNKTGKKFDFFPSCCQKRGKVPSWKNFHNVHNFDFFSSANDFHFYRKSNNITKDVGIEMSKKIFLVKCIHFTENFSETDWKK